MIVYLIKHNKFVQFSEKLLHHMYMKEGNVLFNDALNTFYYGYMVSDI